MSGINENRFMRDDRRDARSLQEQREKKKTRTTAVTVIVVLAVLFAGALFVNSKYVRRNLPAVSVAGINFSAVEYDYFFMNAYNDYEQTLREQLGDGASSMLPGNDKPLKSQIYDEATGQTWADWFGELALSRMSESAVLYNAAQVEGFLMPDEAREKMEENLDLLKQSYFWYGANSFDDFLRRWYSPSMNEKSFRKIVEFVSTVEAYSKHKFDSFSYDADTLAAYYDENRDDIDNFNYRILTIRSDSVDQADYSTEEEYNTAVAAAAAATKGLVREILSGISSEDEFIAAAREYSEEEYGTDDSTLLTHQGEQLGDDYGPWLKEDGRKPGDITTVEVSGGTYIIYFVNRDTNEYRVAEMRQILIQRAALNEDDYAENEEYQAAFEDAETEAKERAEAALELFTAAGATEQALIDLMAEHSDDPTEGGQYTKIYKGMMVPEIDSWLFDPGRQVGDFELVRTESYGYHLVYFSGLGEQYNDFVSDSRMRTADFTVWTESLEKPSAVTRWAFSLTQQ